MALDQFDNLEKLILNNTNISGEGIQHLLKLDHLALVSLSGTKVDSKALHTLAASKSLREVFVWNTAISPDEIQSLRNSFGQIRWETGYQPDPDEILKLSPPLMRNEAQLLKSDEPVILKHNLPGAIIRYTVDGETPDSLKSKIYEKPIAIDGYTVVKTKAYKDEWRGSDIAEYVFFKDGAHPSKGELMTSPDKQYPGEGIITLIDIKKGMPDFYRDPVWMGFKQEPLEGYFYFEKDALPVTSITLSYARNVYANCMPPEIMEVWGGNDKKNLKLLGKIKPEQPNDWGVGNRIEGATIKFPGATYTCYKIIARPLSKLPQFRGADKKEKGWLMVDEVFFN